MAYYDDVKEAADYIRLQITKVPDLAIVLGSGLGDFAGTLSDAVSMSYADLPHWPASKVIGHEGVMVVGAVAGRTIVALAGRCHQYEGHDLKTVTFAVRALVRKSSDTSFLRTLPNVELADGAVDDLASVKRAFEGVTPDLDLRGVVSPAWTARALDTDGQPIFVPFQAGASTICNTDATGKGAGCNGDASYLGTEVNLGLTWRFAPGSSRK